MKTEFIDETKLLNKSINLLKQLSPEGREYLLNRFWSDREISAELKKRYEINRAKRELEQGETKVKPTQGGTNG